MNYVTGSSADFSPEPSCTENPEKCATYVVDACT